MILVFAGAGASAAIDPDLYPTTIKFLDSLPSEITSDPCFKAATSFLKPSPPYTTPEVDIERVLHVLEELSALCEQMSGSSSFPARALRPGVSSDAKSSLINAYSSTNIETSQLSEFFNRMESIGSRVDVLRNEIYSRVYDLYATEPPYSALTTWVSLLDALSVENCGIEVFTTNYDLVLEEAILGDKLLFSSIQDASKSALGRQFDGKKAWLDIELWNPRNIPYTKQLRLTKLHGSVDWQWESASVYRPGRPENIEKARASGVLNPLRDINRRIIVANTGFSGDHQKHIVLYPGNKIEPRDEPFVSFHNHLSRVVRGCDAAIFIGYSFGDEYINSILSELTPLIPKYVINKGKNAPRREFVAGAEFLTDGFTVESVEMCIDDFKKRGPIR